MSQAECSALEESLLNMSQTFVRRTKAVKLEQKTARKLSYFETYIAVIKGYCAILIILLPKSFSNGGYIFSPIAMLLSGFVTTICVQKLVQTGLKYDVFSYSLICQKVLGKQGKLISDIMICLSQFSFSLGQMVFVLKSMQTSVNQLFEVSTTQYLYCGILICCLTPIAWVRDIARFSFSFMIGNCLILLTLVVVTIYCAKLIAEEGLSENIIGFNSTGYLSTVGFAIYSYEGIGVVMPIMQSCACPEKFNEIVVRAVMTLAFVYCFFGTFCYLALGSTMPAYVTEVLPPTNIGTIMIKFLFSLNLIFGFAITINPTTTILEGWLLKGWASTKKKYWTKNLIRFLVCAAVCIVSVTLSAKIDKFLGLLGALLCAPLAMTLPAVCHLKAIARSK